jgi:hypothetical protein
MKTKSGLKRLALSRETVRELTGPELRQAAGGATPTAAAGCLVSLAPSCGCTGYYLTLDGSCVNP